MMRPGSRILYHDARCVEVPKPGTIIRIGEECGAPVYDVLLDSGRMVWGWAWQIEAQEALEDAA